MSWEVVLADGTTEAVTLEGVVEGGVVVPLDADPEIVGDTGGGTPPPVTTRRLGDYYGAWDEYGGDPDAAAQAAFGHLPAVANSYYTKNQQTLNVPKETTRVNRGISPNISLATNGTQRLTGIVSGVSADRAWLDQYLDALDAISRANPSVPVYATLDQEFEVRVTQGTITGGDASFSNYGAALSYFFARARARCPLVKVTYWAGGASGQRPNILTVWKNITEPFDIYLSDGYAQSGTSPSTTWASRNNDVRTGTYAAQYARLNALAGKTISLGVGETGINKANVSDATMASWISNIPDAMETSDMEVVVLFNRDKLASGGNGDWRIDGGTFQTPPRTASIAAMGTAMQTVNGF